MRVPPGPAVESVEETHSEASFRGVLEAERARAERGRYELSLLILRNAQGPAKPGWQRFVAQQAPKLVRSTDRVGRIGADQLGILLPNTPGAGARRLSFRIRSRVAARIPNARLEEALRVYTPTQGRRFAAGRGESARAARRAPALRRAEVSCSSRGALALIERPLPAWKRAMDICLALIGLALLSPLMVGIAAAVKATSPGPVLYRQERTGRGLRRFRIYKFRTMRRGAHKKQGQLQGINEMTGPLFKVEGDPRLTPIGGLLRKASLDELPQLVNVIRGEMTLIGPRALSPLPSEYEAWQLRRFAVTPGIACTWQAHRRSETDFVEWMRSDLEYVDRGFSIWNDLKLLLATIRSVLASGGR